jgi:hypothetical protein
MKSSFLFVYKLNRRSVQNKYVARIVKEETTTQLKWHRGFVDRVVNLWLESILKCPPEICQHFCRFCEELISED